MRCWLTLERPSRKPMVSYKSFAYEAGSWTRPRRTADLAGGLLLRNSFVFRPGGAYDARVRVTKHDYGISGNDHYVFNKLRCYPS